MIDTLEIDGKILSTIKEAARLSSYSRDYITRLAREEKIFATYAGRQWFVDVDSLKSYAESAAMEKEIRKKQLREERRREREVKVAAQVQHTLRIKKSRTLPVHAAVVAVAVLAGGLLGGLWLGGDVARVGLPALGIDASFYQNQTNTAEPTQIAGDKKNILADNLTSNVNHTLASIGDVKNGVLLLPGSTSTLERSFSDSVQLTTLTDGTSAVVQVDADGNEVGNPIPFVVLPVKKEIP